MDSCHGQQLYAKIFGSGASMQQIAGLLQQAVCVCGRRPWLGAANERRLGAACATTGSKDS
jgi:hypothetical protein